jgi:hypothetical protein
VITGDHPVSVAFTVPDGVSVSCDRSTAPVTFDGEGRFVALALIPAVSRFDDLPSSRPMIWGRIPAAASWWSTVSLSGCFSGRRELPAGTYYLYLFPDGRPLSATLRVAGVAGAASFSPVEQASATIAFPEPSIDVATGQMLYASGAAGDVSNLGMLFHIMWQPHDVNVANEAGHCIIRDPPSSTATSAAAGGVTVGAEAATYGPGCNGSGSGGFGISAERVEYHYASEFNVPAGRYGVGGWMAGVGVQDGVGSASLWISIPGSADFGGSSVGSGSGPR